jgi:hypothetical protein
MSKTKVEKEPLLTALPEDYVPYKVTPMTSRLTKNTKEEEEAPSKAHLYRVSYQSPYKPIVNHPI